MKMYEVEVSYGWEGGYIAIEQCRRGGSDLRILVHPDQVETLIKWLQEEKVKQNSHTQK